MTPESAGWCLELLGKVLLVVLAGAGLALGLMAAVDWIRGFND